MNKNLSFKLDVVRGYAALAVLLAHVNQWFVLPLTGISTFGRYFWNTVSHYAVLVFFLLSGFVIVNSLLTNLSRNGQINEVAFLKARSLYPSFSDIAPSLFVLSPALPGMGLRRSCDVSLRDHRLHRSAC